MRTVRLLLFPCAVLALALPAVASPITGQISIGGYAESNTMSMGTASGLDFASGNGKTISGTSGDLYSFGAGTGSFAALGSCASVSGACGTIQDIANFATEGVTTSFLTLTTGGPAVSFDLTSITAVAHGTDANGGSVTFTADGTINFSGYDSTAGTFILTAQGNNIVSFSATTLAATTTPTPTPEPSSLILLTGPMALLIAQRRRLFGKRA